MQLSIAETHTHTLLPGFFKVFSGTQIELKIGFLESEKLGPYRTPNIFVKKPAVT